MQSYLLVGWEKKKRFLSRNSLHASDLIKYKVWMTFINAVNMIKISASQGRRVKRISLNKNQPRTLEITISIMNTVHNIQLKRKPFLSPASWRDRGWIHNFYPQFWCKLLRSVPCSFWMSLLSWYHFRTQPILRGDQGWKGILITRGDRGKRSNRALATWSTKQKKGITED